MVRYALDDVSDEMVLGESVFSPTGELLLASGYRMNDQVRRRLKQLGYTGVYIAVEGTEGIIPETIISEHVQREMSSSVTKIARDIENLFHIKREGTRTVQKLIRENKQSLSRYITSSGLANALEKFIEEILNQSAVILNMSAIKQTDGALFAHAINVTIISLCLGKKFRFSYEELKQLGMGAINYDLGLVTVPREILDKSEPLTEDEERIFAQHTVHGYLMLSQNPVIPPTSAAVALQHHERQDGSGYPRQLKGDNRPPLKDFSRKGVIHRFAEIVAVADTYDMLTLGRLKLKQPCDIITAMRTMIGMSGSQLNSEVVKTLMSIVPAYPVGARIRIANAPVPHLIGYCGVVAKHNPENLEEPIILLYETRNHKRINPISIDLMHHKGFTFEMIT